jgi:WD40 repeat protein
VEKEERPEEKVPEIEVSGPEEAKSRRTWLSKSVFRSHVDAVRGVYFTNREEILVTASDDLTLKLWDVGCISRFTDSMTHESYFTMRGHKGPIFALTGGVVGSDQLLFRAGSEGVIKVWQA